MADTWQERIRTLIAGLTEPDREGEAREAIRGLIGKIVATPVPTKDKRSTLELMLHGDLAWLVALSLGPDQLTRQQKTSLLQEVSQTQEFLAAVGGFEPSAYRSTIQVMGLTRFGREADSPVESLPVGRAADDLRLVAGTGFEPVTFRL